MHRLLILSASLLALATPSNATVIWSIPFNTDWMPCGDGVLLTPAVPPSTMPGLKPCAFYYATYPWDQCQPITIIGYNMIHEVTNQASSTWAVIGSGHGGDGADRFAHTGGTGTTHHGMMFSAGTGVPQGPRFAGDTYSHIDVYGSCSGGQQRVIGDIYYTSP